MAILLFLTTTLPTAEKDRSFTVGKPSAPEYGHGLTAREAAEGWISLFDGATAFGWRDGEVENGTLTGGVTTMAFADYEMKAQVVTGGELHVGGQAIGVASGRLNRIVKGRPPSPIRLGPRAAVRTLAIRPLGLASVFNGKDFAGWTVLRHPRLPDDRQATWTVEDGAIHAIGGPGGLELDEHRFGDVVVQLEIETKAPLVNGGVFFRAIAGDFLNGYEAQVFNACYHHDPAQPARYSTGAIDDRQLARRLVSRDKVPFTMTIMAVGPHIATWVNGYAMTDWNDTRAKDANPRRGLRLEPGALQLQAHDPRTDVAFRGIRIGSVD